MWLWFSPWQNLWLRAFLAFLTAFFLMLSITPSFRRRLLTRQIGQSVRDDGPQAHLKKTGTPTMGGLVILFAITVAVLIWGDLKNHLMWLVLFITLSYGAIGFIDDYRKVIQRSSKGLPARWKFLWQSLLALLAAFYLYINAGSPAETQLFLPYLKIFLPLGIGFCALVYFTLVGASNAVNLTDGLDGLAIFPTVLVGLALGIIAYCAGSLGIAQNWFIPYVKGAQELLVFSSALIGAGLGFLWFNAYPAEIFMGDVGSLGLGAALAIVAIIIRQELLLFLMGGIFVAETLSVILQVASFKLTRKRIFKMSPLHHHFELSGWAESKVIVRFWIITILLVVIGLAGIWRL